MKKILLVDDEKLLAEAVKDNLESSGFEVIIANDGLGAMERVKERPDLIILDVMMPGIDGIEVLRRLRDDTETARIPVIMLTAKSESESIFNAIDAGSTDYIIKPFYFSELLKVIKKYI